jgi:outer membrane protein OmpA-like peptidoglycan-associated protein
MTKTRRTVITVTVYLAIASAAAGVAFVVTGALAPAQIARPVTLSPPPGRGLDRPWWEAITVTASKSDPKVATFVVPSDMIFATDSATVSDTGRSDLVRLARTQLLAAHSIVIAGATDSRGTRAHNLWLSRARADAAAAIVLAAGVDPGIIHIETWADDHPVADEHGPDPTTAQARNRRVVIEVTR